MRNEIVLNVFDAFAIKDLVTKAIESNYDNDLKKYDMEKWEEFIRMFDMAFTAPSKMEEMNLEHLHKEKGGK